MKRITFIFLAVLLCAASMTSCGNIKNDTDSTASSVSVEPVMAGVDISSLPKECHGYGQGVQTDDKNRTLGALDFNREYGKYNAKAISEESDNLTLTFDQGYENGYTSKILDTLKEKNVKATFFLVQDYAERNPELVQRMIDEGHSIGNHSVHHYSMPSLSEDTCRGEIMGLHQYIKENYGVNMKQFRPPMGEYSEQSLAVTDDCGYETVLWSFAYADWNVDDQPDPETALQKLIDAAHPGAVYLLHSVSSTNAQILGEMIDGIRAKGLEFN